MAKLELEIVGYNDSLNSLTVNGKRVKMINNKNNTRTCFVEAEKAEVLVFKTHNYTGKHWFWWNLLYYLISIFGIFDFNNNKRCLVVDFRFNLKLENDTKVIMKINNFEDGGRFAELESEVELEEISNIQCFDKIAQKRQKKMKKAKIGIFFGSVALIAILVVLIIKFGG